MERGEGGLCNPDLYRLDDEQVEYPLGFLWSRIEHI